MLVTRARQQAEQLGEALEQAGAAVIAVPLIRFEPLPGGVDTVLSGLPGYDAVIFTSANAVRALGGGDLRSARRVVAAGPATRSALVKAGVAAVAVPAEFSAAGVARLLGDGLEGQRFLLPRAEAGLDDLPHHLREAGAVVHVVAVYRTRPEPGAAGALETAMAGGIDVVTFLSPTAVRAFAAAGGRIDAPTVVACIGSTTAEAARASGFGPGLVAMEHSVPGLVAAISDHFASHELP